MKGLRGLIKRYKTPLDDFGRASVVRKRLVFPHGEMIIGHRSYLLIKKEREAEGAKCPSWESLQTYYES